MRLYFLSTSRAVVFCLFFSVEYLEVPGRPLLLWAVHSRMTCVRLPFLLAIMCFGEWVGLLLRGTADHVAQLGG